MECKKSRIFETTEFTPMPKRPKLVVCCGVPGCGKSTYIKNYCEGFVHISFDDILVAVEGKYKFNENHNKLYRKVLNHLFVEAVVAEFDVVVDMTCSTLKSRTKWLSRLRQLEAEHDLAPYTTTLLVFEYDLNTCVQRRESDPRANDCNWRAVISEMHERIVAEPPSENEGWDKVERIKCNGWQKSST